MAKHFLDGYKTYDTSGGHGNARQWKQAFQQRMTGEEAQAILQQQSRTPHELLGVPADATAAMIKKAFRQLIHEWHPDHNQHRIEEAEAMSKQLIAAYTLLTA